MYMSESTNPVHSLSFRRASLRSELTFLLNRGGRFHTLRVYLRIASFYPRLTFDALNPLIPFHT